MAQLQKGWHGAGGTAAGSGTAGFGSVERARGVTARPCPRSTAPWLFPEGFGCPGLCWPLFLGLLLSLFGVEMAGMLFAAGAAGCGCTAHGVPHVMCTGISTPWGLARIWRWLLAKNLSPLNSELQKEPHGAENPLA